VKTILRDQRYSGGIVGGASGKVSGKKKIDVYLEYQEITDNWYGSVDPDPKNKKFCKSLMKLDPETGDWVLHYHLHT